MSDNEFILHLPKSLHTELAMEAERQGVPLELLIVTRLSRECGASKTLRALNNGIESLKKVLEERRGKSNGRA